MEQLFSHISETDLRFLNSLIKAMAEAQDEQSLLDLILDQFIEKTGAEVGAFIFNDPQKNCFIPHTIKTEAMVSNNEISFSATVFKTIEEKREAILTFDTSEDENINFSQSVAINNIHAILAFPLEVNKSLYGMIYFDSRNNRQKFNEKARQLLAFFAPIASLTLEQALSAKKIHSENQLLKSQLGKTAGLPKMIGHSEPMQHLFKVVHKVAAKPVSVLINGENGTGKDLVARAIHELSDRKEKPFIAQFVGNIPASILESELFGYKKGAFTGAINDKPGLFEAVDKGTLFLDEIGELTSDLQAKLLTVLQNKEIKRLGENMVRKVDVRIIAATNRDLKQLIRKGAFREDLYYRLNVINLTVPPLRERREDIPDLVNHFAKQQYGPEPVRFSQKALSKLMAYHWPGNVRQLENLVARTLILASDAAIKENDIEFDNQTEDFNGTMEEYKNLLIKKRLKEFKGNKTLTAKSLDISLRSLQQKVKNFEEN